MTLSIMCVTRGEKHAWKFLEDLRMLSRELDAELVLGVDRPVVTIDNFGADKVVPVKSEGYVESVLERVLSETTGDYVLRMDDDERCSPAMRKWLLEKQYLSAPHWKFCTANLWGNETSVIVNPPLWPDHHTRLSVRSMAGGRHSPHCGSPFGGGELAPVIHEHHKFLVKSLEERREIAGRYDAYAEGYGTSDHMRPFSLPETCYDHLVLAPLGDGTVRGWNAHEFWRENL